MASGDPAQALRLLSVIPEEDFNDPLQRLFLVGVAALELGQTEPAIEALQAIVIARPDLPRPRLELARAYFVAGQDRNARRQFERVRATETDPALIANIDAFLAQIEARRRWRFRGSLAFVPDSNANAATSAREVTVPAFGGPATLSGDDRARSGAGLELALGTTGRSLPDDRGGQWQLSLDGFARLFEEPSLSTGVFSLSAERLQSTAQQQVAAGVSLQAQFDQNDAQSRDTLLTLSLDRRFGPRVQASFGGGAGARDYPTSDTSLRLIELNSSVVRAFGAARSLGVSARLEDAAGEVRGAAATTLTTTGLLYQELPRGVVLTLRPGLSYAWFHDHRGTLFSENRRVDVTYRIEGEVAFRAVRFAGFQPFLTGSLEQRESVSKVFEYDRWRAGFGVTRQF